MGGYPEFIWQVAQHLKKEYAEKGREISVFVEAKVSINGKLYQPFIDPKADLAKESWNYLWHNEWILPSPLQERESSHPGAVE